MPFNLLALKEGWIKLSSCQEFRVEKLIYNSSFDSQSIDCRFVATNDYSLSNYLFEPACRTVILANTVHLGLVTVLGESVVSDEETSMPVHIVA